MHRSVTEQLWLHVCLRLWDFIVTEDCVQKSMRELKLELKVSLRLKLLQRCEFSLKHKDCWCPAVCAPRTLILLYLWTPEDSDGQWKTTEYKLRPYNSLTEFYLHAFYVIISWFTATEEFWLVNFRITTCWYEQYFQVKLKLAFIGVIVLILCSFLNALSFYIDHVNTN